MSFLIATPMYGGQCTSAYFESCLNLKEDLTTTGVEHDWLTITNESLITRARNTAAATFLETDFSALLFIDADIRFQSIDVAKLWNLNAPVAAGCYRLKTEEYKLSSWMDGKQIDNIEGYENAEPLVVSYAATGFMMIKREVFEDLEKVVEFYYEEKEKRYDYFQTTVVDHALLSEDYLFCEMVRGLGMDILLDPSIRLGHIGMKEYAS